MTTLNDACDLGFFGKVTASVSHELKNVLAIVNENAGLIEDMLGFAAAGRPLDPNRLLKAARAIKTQIGRGDGIIKNLNRFAHSVDEPTAAIGLDHALELALSLTARMAASRGVAVTLTPPAEAVMVKTAPFAFQQLMWRCLDGALTAAAAKGAGLDIAVEAAGSGARIRITATGGCTPDPLLEPKDQQLLSAAGARVDVEPEYGQMVVTLDPIRG